VKAIAAFYDADKMSQEKARLLRALGRRGDHHADGGASRHPENYIMKGRAIAAAHPNAIFRRTSTTTR